MIVSGASAVSEELVRIGLAVPNNAGYVQFYAADALGFYKDAGIKSEITVYRGGGIAGGHERGRSRHHYLLRCGRRPCREQRRQGKDRRCHRSDTAWLAVPGARQLPPIKTLKDLDGKKVGVATKAGTADMFALWVADRAGVHVQTIPVGGGGMVPALRGGQVDAIAMFPVSLQLLATGEARSLVDLGKEMVPTLPDVIVASQEMMDKHADAVRGTLAALYKTVGYMHDNREWALKYLKEFTKEKDDSVNVLTYEQVVRQLSQDGMVKAEWVANSINIAAKVWGIDDLRKVNPDDIFSNAFLPGAKH